MSIFDVGLGFLASLGLAVIAGAILARHEWIKLVGR